MIDLPLRKPPRQRAVRAILVLVYTPFSQTLEDLFELKKLVESRAPEIAVVVVGDTVRSQPVLDALPDIPRLFVSFTTMKNIKPRRGAVHAGIQLRKDEEQTLLESGGLPVPPAVVLEPGCRIDEAVLGEFVVEKPLHFGSNSTGEWIRLRRTRDVRYIPPEDYPEGHPGRKAPMLVQRFIDTGPFAASYRILTFYGQPLYAVQFTSALPRPPLSASDDHLMEYRAASNVSERTARLIDEKDVVRLARRVQEVAPEMPLKGVDILRDVRDGSLWIVEFNSAGNSWGFSVSRGNWRTMIQDEVPPDHPQAHQAGIRVLRRQFDAFERVAGLLVSKTRTAAR